ncbi:MAG: class I poly(R)-hydroxyalkanoic acid synthase, partial [Pseudomonadota bacterium]|nr:class I poly(R)-hydroxyalkanoic acid synthase [Pseudomonadota bacterium]
MLDNQQQLQVNVPDPAELRSAFKEIALSSERLMADFLRRRIQGNGPAVGDDVGIGRAFMELSTRLMFDPLRLAENQMNLWRDWLDLWQSSVLGMMGVRPDPVIRPAQTDRRFRDDAWEDYLLFDFIKQSYLLTARWLHRTVTSVEGLDEQTARKVDFYTRQFVDALAPTNFVLTNPEALREIVCTGGQSLLNGMRNLLDDLQRGNGQLNIRMTDLDAFEVGQNIGVTPGKVIYQNDMMQLVQYEPSTPQVKRRPLLVMSAWINKYYILDLRPKNSFIKWALDQGHTVFVISWVNPSEDYADKSFDDYMLQGPLAALDAIGKATGEREVNAVGYCLGGTLLAATAAYMAAAGDDRLKSIALFTTMLDFSRPGELEVFIDEEQITNLERRMESQGYLDGSEMATTFSMLRANDLIWSFFINNYL